MTATLEGFRSRYPEFSSVADDLAQSILDESIAQVGDTWPETLVDAAQMALAAHTMAVEGAGSRNAAAATLGPMTQRKAGAVGVP